MENRKLFGFDLDGTLLTSNTEKEGMSIEIKNLITKIKKSGHIAAILTGRTLQTSMKIYEYFGFDTVMANNNGALISHPKDKSFEKQILFLEGGLEKTIMNDAKVVEFNHDAMIIYPSIIYSQMEQGSFISRVFTRHKKVIKYKTYNNGDELPNGSFALLIEIKDSYVKRVQELCDHLSEKYSNELDITWWTSFDRTGTIIEVANKKARKDFALEKIAEYYNISMENTFAFGDGGNDLHMLERANLGIAMLNGGDLVKKAANDTTKYTSDEFGVLKYIEDNNLI